MKKDSSKTKLQRETLLNFLKNSQKISISIQETCRKKVAKMSISRRELKEEKLQNHIEKTQNQTQSHAHSYLPSENDNKVEYVPNIPQVRALVEDETQCQYLQRCLHTEDAQEVGLRRLQLERQGSTILLGQVLLEGQDHTIGNDGQQNCILENSGYRGGKH